MTININRLTWTAATPGDRPLAGYRLYNADNDALITETAALTYDHGPLEPGTYRYYVRAYDTSGAMGDASNVITLTIEEPVDPNVVFIADSVGGGGGVDGTGFITYAAPIFPSTPANAAGTLVSGSVGGYDELGIKTFLNGIPEIVMALRVPTAELLASPQTAYFTSLTIAGITTTPLTSAGATFSTDTSQPGFTQLLWNWGPWNFDLTHLTASQQYTATFA